MSDPISYIVSYSNGSLSVLFYTHKYKSGKLISSEYKLGDNVSNFFDGLGVYDLGPCNSYQNFKCSGLDGDSWRISKTLEGKVTTNEYWSPESQPETEPGKVLLEVKARLQAVYKIDELAEQFKRNLANGRYWNYGESVFKR